MSLPDSRPVEEKPRWRRRLTAVPPYTLLSVLLLVVLLVPFVFIKQSEWQNVYVAAAAILGGMLANKDLVKGRVYTLTLWYGSVMTSALILGVLCAWSLLSTRRERLGSSVSTEEGEVDGHLRQAA